MTFLADHRDDLLHVITPTLILQCTDDIIAPVAVGEYMQQVMPDATMVLINTSGHCSHLSEPTITITEMKYFLSTDCPTLSI